jgi:hypothetical protein
MPTNTENKKAAPGIEKQKFCKLFYPFPSYTVLNRINCIIYERRSKLIAYEGKTKTQILRTQFIEEPEYKEYFETYGYPDGIEFLKKD